MIKKSILILLLAFGSTSLLKAQQLPTVHKSLMTPVWKLITDRTYKKNALYKMVPFFPAPLVAMAGKEVELPGYIIPIKASSEHSEFMLAVLPYDQCPYCGQGDIPMMVEVHMVKPVGFSETPVKIKGKLVLNDSGDYRSEIFLMDAQVVPEK